MEPEAPAPPHDSLVVLGRIARPHGVHGWVRLRPANPDPDLAVLRQLPRVWIGDERLHPFGLEHVRLHGRLVLLKLGQVDSRSAAEGLVHSPCLAEKAALPRPGEGEIYHHEVIGRAVYTTDGRYVGRIGGVLTTGANDLWLVQGQLKEYLVPVVREIVCTIDSAAGRVVIDPPAGLLDL